MQPKGYSVKLAILAVFALVGCVDAPPPQPSAAQQKLQSACDQGDTGACKVIFEKESRENAAYNARVQNALNGIGRDTSAIDTYVAMAPRPQPAPVITPLTTSPVMINCYPYEPRPAPGPCPR